MHTIFDTIFWHSFSLLFVWNVLDTIHFEFHCPITELSTDRLDSQNREPKQPGRELEVQDQNSGSCQTNWWRTYYVWRSMKNCAWKWYLKLYAFPTDAFVKIYWCTNYYLCNAYRFCIILPTLMALNSCKVIDSLQTHPHHQCWLFGTFFRLLVRRVPSMKWSPSSKLLTLLWCSLVSLEQPWYQKWSQTCYVASKS